MTSSLLIDHRLALGAFDFDGNILAPETPIYVVDRHTGAEVPIAGHELDQHPELLSGADAPYRWHEDTIASLIHFRDYHSDPRHSGPDGLKSDIETAIARGAISPSFASLKEKFLIPARLCAIITSRGHGPDNLARILWIINEALLSEGEKVLQYDNIARLYEALYPNAERPSRDQALRFYFDTVTAFYPVSNTHLAKYLSWEDVASMPERKTLAMEHLINRTRGLREQLSLNVPLSIGFSDDSLGNIEAMLRYFMDKRKNGTLGEDTVHIYFTGKQSEVAKLEKYRANIELGETMATIRV